MASPKPADDDLPSNVHTELQLKELPQECLSDNVERPLRHVDLKGNEFHYSLAPMQYSVSLILVVELLERFAFYGVYYTQTLYLTGVYDDDWNAGFTSVDAASFVSVSTAVAYTTPFIGAVLADSYLGDYKTILLGCLGFYVPGLSLLAMTSSPGFLGSEFNTNALAIALLGLWPLGTGIIKSVVNVFGARQFHPFLQSSLIESYYVNFYTSINVGALLGILILPTLARYHLTSAYALPVAMLGTAVLLFAAWTPRFIIAKPAHSMFKRKKRNDNDFIPLSTMFCISLLIVPFCIAYSQMPTTFIVQGTVMRTAFGFIDAATINLVDTMSVLFSGFLTGTYIYPALQKHKIKIPTTYKFAIGSFFGVLSILWALVVESKIHRAYYEDGSQISILWQAPSYVLIGVGEIFAVSAAYEVAFTASSPETKALSSAINIFCVGGIPNVVCILLYQACREWFRNTTHGTTNIQRIEDYATARVSNYFWVLVSILVFGVLLNILPPVRDMVDGTEQKAAEIVKTPLTPMLRRRGTPGEETPLIRRKFGKEPHLQKMGSMREGPKIGTPKKIKSRVLQKLYYTGPIQLFFLISMVFVLPVTTAEQMYTLVGVSGTLQDGFELRDRLDYVDDSSGSRQTVPAIFMGTALVRGYKAYFDIKPSGYREYLEEPALPRVPNPVIIPTGCYHDANIYWLYLVAPEQVLSILAGEPRFLSITPDTGLVDLTADETSSSVRQLALNEIQAGGYSNRTTFALPLVTGVWFDVNSFVESPIIYKKQDGTRVTSYDGSLALWAGVNREDLLADKNSNQNDQKDKAWEIIYNTIRKAEMDSSLTDRPQMCLGEIRFGVSSDHLRLNYPLTRTHVRQVASELDEL